jgi:hypothetical protein
VTPGVAASTPVSAFPSLEKDLANDALRNLQAGYQDLLGKEAKNAGTIHQLQSKISELSGSIEQDLPRLQERYNDLLRRHQSLLLNTMYAKGLVSRAINLPFDQVNEFDGSDAVITDTNIKRQKKVRQFGTLLTQSKFFDGLVRNDIASKQKLSYEKKPTHLGRSYA